MQRVFDTNGIILVFIFFQVHETGGENCMKNTCNYLFHSNTTCVPILRQKRKNYR